MPAISKIKENRHTATRSVTPGWDLTMRCEDSQKAEQTSSKCILNMTDWDLEAPHNLWSRLNVPREANVSFR